MLYDVQVPSGHLGGWETARQCSRSEPVPSALRRCAATPSSRPGRVTRRRDDVDKLFHSPSAPARQRPRVGRGQRGSFIPARRAGPPRVARRPHSLFNIRGLFPLPGASTMHPAGRRLHSAALSPSLPPSIAVVAARERRRLIWMSRALRAARAARRVCGLERAGRGGPSLLAPSTRLAGG